MEHGEEAFLGKASRSQTPTRGQRLPVSTLDAQSHVIREGPSQKIKQGGVSSDLTPLCLLQCIHGPRSIALPHPICYDTFGWLPVSQVPCVAAPMENWQLDCSW